jgi:hypothetical protein
LALLFLAASANGVSAQSPVQSGDVVASRKPSGIGFRFITELGSVAFVVPPDWSMISVQSRPPISLAAFQAPNPADQGTSDSTNVAISVFQLDTALARTARSNVGQQFGPAPPVVSRYNEWTIYTHAPVQGATTYVVLDGVRDLPELHSAVAVRLAWPKLSGNTPSYDADMTATYHRLLDSVSGAKGPYTPDPNEVVRRPTS